MKFIIDKTDWTPVKLSDVVTKKEENDRDNAQNMFDRFLKVEHLDAGSLHVKRWASQEAGDKINPTFYKIFRKGQVLFPTRNPHLRRAALASFDGICGEKTLTLAPKKDVVLAEFLPFIFHSDDFYTYTTSVIVGSTNPHVRWRDVADFEFLLPPTAQQRDLSELLWTMEKNIRSKRVVEEKLTIVKRSISQTHYYDKTIPRLHISDVCEKVQDGSHYSPANLYDDNDGSRYIYLTSKNIRSSGLDMKKIQYVDSDFHKGIYKRCDVKLGDILLTKDGANTGLATLNTISEEMSLLSSVCLLRVNEKMMSTYLCHYLNSDIGFTQMTGRMTGTAIKRLTLKTINKTRIPCPNIEQQENIAKKLDRIDNTMRLNSRHIADCVSVQKSFLNKVF